MDRLTVLELLERGVEEYLECSLIISTARRLDGSTVVVELWHSSLSSAMLFCKTALLVSCVGKPYDTARCALHHQQQPTPHPRTITTCNTRTTPHHHARRLATPSTQPRNLSPTLKADARAQAAASSHTLAQALAAPNGQPNAQWTSELLALVNSPTLAYASEPLKLATSWDFAKHAYTMYEVERDVALLPPMFVAHGVRHGDGIYNQPMPDGFSYQNVEQVMETATVVMLNAGFVVPALADVSLAMLEATRLPIWLNVYLSRPGLKRSTQLHTDQQDVFLVQTTGCKRWRVYKPPPPADALHLDPFVRGKGTDQLEPRAGDLLIDTVTEPGEVLYIPAGFPHETSTEGVDDGGADDYSVHLTIGVDTHLWGLSYATMRSRALAAAGESDALEDGTPTTALPLERWQLLHTPLPLGFLAAQHLEPLCADDGPTPTLEEAREALVSAMADELARRMREAEPGRWGGDLVRDLKLKEWADVFYVHHRDVIAEQTAMYRRAAAGPPRSANEHKGAINTLFGSMDRLDALMARLRGEAAAEEPAGAPPAAGGSSGFGGVSKARSVGSKKGSKAKAKRR